MLAAIAVENFAQPSAQRHTWLAAEREQRIKRRAGSGFGGARSNPLEEAEFERRGKIEDLVPDCTAASCGTARRSEHPERQVLDRKIRMPIGRCDPTAPHG